MIQKTFIGLIVIVIIIAIIYKIRKCIAQSNDLKEDSTKQENSQNDYFQDQTIILSSQQQLTPNYPNVFPAPPPNTILKPPITSKQLHYIQIHDTTLQCFPLIVKGKSIEIIGIHSNIDLMDTYFLIGTNGIPPNVFESTTYKYIDGKYDFGITYLELKMDIWIGCKFNINMYTYSNYTITVYYTII